MLQKIRDNAQSTIAKVIVGLIVVTFALFGVESIIGGLGGEPEVAEVNGEEITEYEFLREVELKRRQVINQMGGNVDPSLINEEVLNKTVLEDLIKQKLLLQTVAEMGFDISDVSISHQIQVMPQFQVDGKFSNELFLNSIRNIGMSTSDFKSFLKKQIKISQLQNGLVASSFVTEKQLADLVGIDRQQRDALVVTINFDAVKTGVAARPDQIKAYYEEHKEELKTEESVSVSYIVLDKDRLSQEISVTDEELKERYDQNREEFTRPEEREVAHILIEITDDLAENEAVAKAGSLISSIKSGERFETVARENSGDPGSASQGGYLGFAPKGTYAVPFENAVDKLAAGEISEPVVTEFGVHVIKLLSRREAQVPSFDEVKGKLLAQLREKKAYDKYVDMSQKLADISYESVDLLDPAEELGLEIQKGEVAKSTANSLLGHPSVVAAAFSDDLVKEQLNSEPIEISRDQTIVLRSDEFHPGRLKTLEEATPEITRFVEQNNRLDVAKKKAEDVLARLKSGEKPEEIASNESVKGLITAEDYNKIVRNDTRVSPVVLEKIFRIKNPKSSDGVVYAQVDDTKGVNIIALKSVKPGSLDSLSSEQQNMFARAVSGQTGTIDFQDYVGYIEQHSEVERL
ncbi:MAG: parvulin peptidyl-prolyl isomerase [Proteobacteria bacterium]|nr:MAG: parvulin peptidyl-prolyl isomerase [Pseudomonadota bacterium]